jgi:hypothetical protein
MMKMLLLHLLAKLKPEQRQNETGIETSRLPLLSRECFNVQTSVSFPSEQLSKFIFDLFKHWEMDRFLILAT